MSIHLHIERLILEGLPVDAHQGRYLRAALETELTRLLATGGLSHGLAEGGAIAEVRAGTMQMNPGATPTVVGADIAKALHKGLGQNTKRSES